MISVYVAGSSKEQERAKAAMTLVQQSPVHSLTHDWLAVMEASKPDDELSAGELVAAARDDLAGVLRASALWFLLPQTPSAGAWFELGYFARLLSEPGTLRRLVISGPGAHGRLFVAWAMSRGAERFERDGDAAVALGLLPEVQP